MACYGQEGKPFPVHKAWLNQSKSGILRVNIQGDSRLEDITAAGDFLGLSDQKSSYKHVSDFGRLGSYDRLKRGIEGNDY